jgi:predicted deacylase
MHREDETLTDVQHLTLRPGESRRVWLGVGSSWVGSLRIPLFVAKGSRPGAKLVVVAGQHGDEIYSVLGAVQVINSVKAQELTGELWVLPCLNVLGFMAGSRNSPYDYQDMNRVHPGRDHGTFTEQIIGELYKQVLPGADLLLDVHGGSLEVGDIAFGRWVDVPGKPSVYSIVSRLGWDFLVTPPDTSPGSFGSAATSIGVPHISLEACSCVKYPRENASAIASIVVDCMRCLGMLDGPVPQPKEFPRKRLLPQRSQTGGIFNALVSMGETVGSGQHLGDVMDLLGNVIQTVTAADAGIVTLLRTDARVHAGEWLLALAVPAGSEN